MRIDWIDGGPENFLPGMILQTGEGLVIVGDISVLQNRFGGCDFDFEVSAWGWIVKPYELEHIRSMIVSHSRR